MLGSAMTVMAGATIAPALPEMALHFAGAEGLLRQEQGRVSITRRLFRSGESEYRLNGKRVRLKEIRDLLMDTGLGIRAYSVIEQGRIFINGFKDLVLNG